MNGVKKIFRVLAATFIVSFISIPVFAVKKVEKSKISRQYERYLSVRFKLDGNSNIKTGGIALQIAEKALTKSLIKFLAKVNGNVDVSKYLIKHTPLVKDKKLNENFVIGFKLNTNDKKLVDALPKCGKFVKENVVGGGKAKFKNIVNYAIKDVRKNFKKYLKAAKVTYKKTGVNKNSKDVSLKTVIKILREISKKGLTCEFNKM